MPAGKLVFFKKGVDFDLGCEEYGILAACQEAGVEEVKSWYGVMSSEFYIRTDIDLIVRVYESSDPSVRPTAEILPTLPMREVLEDLRMLNRIQFEECSMDPYNTWDGTVTFWGARRFIYSLWHDGCNESGYWMMGHGTPVADMFHEELIKKWSVFPEPTIKF
jgi:hypothetical protein